jgi:uncharacterized repeat protein (TIGR02543 family)
VADIKNVEFDSKSGYQQLTFTSYSSTKSGSNWVITATVKVVCSSTTSISATPAVNNRGFYGTIGGNDIGKVWFKSNQAWSGGTYTYTVKFTIPFSTTTSVAVSLGVCDGDGNTGSAGTWPKTITGYTMTLTLPTYAVTYDANGGTGTTASQTKTYGKALTLQANGFTAPANKSVTGFKVTFDANGGTCSTDTLTSTRTAKYAYSNWNTNAGGTGTSYAAGASYTGNAALTLYAIWSISYTNNAVTLPTPTRSGYKFNGWATSSSATSGSTGKYTPTKAVTLYATWIKSTSMWTNVDGTWKQGSGWANVDGAWKKGTAFVNVSGTWKEGK